MERMLSLVFCVVCFVDHSLSVCRFTFGHSIVSLSSINHSYYSFDIYKLFFLLIGETLSF